MALRFHLSMPRTSRVERDFDCLLQRMRHRLYPESVQVLTSYWLRTVRARAYQPAEWKVLDHLFQQAIADPRTLATPAVQSLATLREWIGQIRHIDRQPSLRSQLPFGPARQVSADSLVPYLFRLLNEWLPVEVAHLLVNAPEEGPTQSGIPLAVVARAVERLLLREHLSRATLESMLFPGLLSPRFFYPADSEIMQDVVLFLLGQTGAPAPARMPAALLCVSPDAHLSLPYSEAVNGAVLTAGSGAEELHVSIPRAQALELLKTDHVRFTSAVVTMDGQLWQADKLQTGERDSIVYRPAGRLRIDYSSDHARMVLPWSETRGHWSGPIAFTDRLAMFGREWHISHWEQDTERTLLHLVFVASLPITAVAPDAKTRLARSHPAEIDMAWAGLEKALAESLARRNLEPMDQLRRPELIPLGCALFGLAESVMSWRSRSRNALDTRLRGIRYLSAGLFPTYGRIPWRILPERVRRTLLASRIYDPLVQETFQGLPEGRAHRASWLWNVAQTLMSAVPRLVSAR